ncbi:MAG: nickel-dependent lactate racemase [candidate division WOR-3 bacterium]|nr:nickel-dependent lactate racemase [candidate division WOR-3 bacterium]
MKINLTNGTTTISLELPEKNLLGILTPNPMPKEEITFEVEELKADLRNFLSGAKRILIVVNDYTRPTPTADIISMIESEINKYDFRFIVACGSHSSPTSEQLIQIFGKYAELYKEKILIHNARDITSLRFLGKTRFGTPVWLNQAVWEVDKIITINSVEPHYFAGFTGGRKSFLPGIAGIETITANHKLSLQPEAKTLSLNGNPVHEDMTEIAKMVPREIFSLQCVINDKHQLYSIRYGNIFQSFLSAVEDAKKIFCVPIKEKADIVLAFIQPPYDINFYQSQKAIENAKLALKDKGILIVVSQCREGVGDDEFIKVIADNPSPQVILENIKKNFKLGYQKSAKLLETLTKAEIWTVMPIDDKIIQSIFMKPFPEVNSALQKALQIKGEQAKVLVFPDASLTVPLLS